MKSYLREEKKLKKEESKLQEKLKELEERYKRSLFLSFDNIKNKNLEIKEKIKKDLKNVKKVEESKKIKKELKEIKKDFESYEKEEKGIKKDFESYEKEEKGIKERIERYTNDKNGIRHSNKLVEKAVVKIHDKEIEEFSKSIEVLKKEISKILIGQEEIIDGLIRGLICNGHVLLEGVPGIAKTLVIRALGKVSGCSVKRVQFTVDLLPTDIIGITSYTPKKGFEVIKGPIFANFLIADEINRSPPKTQSALIEAMQEKQVTIGKQTFELPNPFFVMATKNPLENEGVYSLPEAQVDRFLFKLIMKYPKRGEEKRIMEDNINLRSFEDFKLKSVFCPKDILKMQKKVQEIYLGDSLKDYILSIVDKTRDRKFKYSEYITFGASPRATIALFITSKAKALMEGRNFVLPEDIRAIVYDVLRHRIILSYKAVVDRVDVDYIINEILKEIEL